MKQLLLGIALGVLALAGVRLAFFGPEPPVHYHAAFAVVVDGERIDLSNDRYMEDVTSCAAAGGDILPRQRAHLHDNEPDIVHIHHDGVTWGHFLANLGFRLDDDYLILDGGRRLLEEDGKSLTFIVNGLVVPSVYDRLIRSEDRLLIAYGSEDADAVLESRFPEVSTEAGAFNLRDDPAGCAGAEPPGLGDRLRHAFIGQ